MDISGLGQRDGSTIKVETILNLDGNKKDYVLRKTGQNKVTLFKVIGIEYPTDIVWQGKESR